MPNCEWCGPNKEAVSAGQPHSGPLSWMCERCRARLCKKDDTGAYIEMPLEDAQKKYPKGFMFS